MQRLDALPAKKLAVSPHMHILYTAGQMVLYLLDEFCCLLAAHRLARAQFPQHIFTCLLYKRLYRSVSLLASVPGIVTNPGSLLLSIHRSYCCVDIDVYLLRRLSS